MNTAPTPYKDIDHLLDRLRTNLQAILQRDLVGVYLFGSLAVGDFDYNISDIDVVAVISTELTHSAFLALDLMHGHIVPKDSQWHDRLELCYITAESLAEGHPCMPIAILSPGEPFNFKESGADWIINRYVLRELGVALCGPPPKVLVSRLPYDMLMSAAQANMKEWEAWLTNKPNSLMPQTESVPMKYQAQAILTMCRELYRLSHNGEVASKVAAGKWALKVLPEWSHLIEDAIICRQALGDPQRAGRVTPESTLRFVRFAMSQCPEPNH